LVYEIPLALAGDYNVDLHFAELFFGIGVNGGGAGSRVFNIDIENSQVQINNYDIFVEAGDAATAIVESYKAINVTDGSLTITLTGVVENPKISGIGVFDTALPIADAGSDQTINLPTNTVTINGSGVDPDGGAIVSYLWTQESGPGGSATLTGDTTENLVASDLLAGDYVFRLTVTDDENTTGFDDVTITVVPEPGNEAPVAIASGTPLTGTAPLLVSFMGSSSTDDVAVTTYLWDFQDGNTSAEADPTHTFTTAGTFDVLLTVTDAGSLTDTATVTVVVSAAANEAPVAVATGTPLTGTAPLLVSFMGSDSTDDVEVTSYLWDFQDGNTSTEADPSNTFTTAGTYNVLLTVTDAEGLTDNETVIVVVNDATNQAPTAIIAANPITGEAGLVVTFDASNSEDDIAVTSYLWDFGDGSAMSTEEIIEHTYVSIGSYTATLTVEDAEGLSSTASIIITVTDENGNMPPVAIAEVEILSGLLVDLTGSNSTSSIGDLTYSWDFGDGSDPSTEADLEYLYQLSGTYTVTLTVTDENGITDQDTIEITVDKQGVDIEVRFAVNPPQKGSDVANIIFDNLPDDVTVKNITVHDIGGRYIGGYSLPAPLNGIKLTNYDIPIFDLQSGLYLVRVILSNDETVLVKLLINN
jgi:PKD repeat protein